MDRKAVLCAVIGGVVGTFVGVVLMLAVCFVLSFGTLTWGEITCNGLRVVDATGHTKI